MQTNLSSATETLNLGGRHFEHVWCVCVAGAMLYAADVAF